MPLSAFACYASGICSGVSYCPPAYFASSTICNCPPSYGCGQYGCYKLRARGSKSMMFDESEEWRTRTESQLHGSSPVFVPLYSIKQDRGSKPLAVLDERRALAMASPTAAELPVKGRTLQDPNEAFLECCIDRQLPDGCLNKCNFKNYNRQSLLLMYLHQNACPMKAIREMQFCAAQGRDHRPCCMRNGITTTLAGDKCLTLCDQRPGRVTQLDMSFLPCFDRFENMKACFWNDIIRYFR